MYTDESNLKIHTEKRRSRWWTAGLLIALTLGLGAASRTARTTEMPALAPAGGGVHFSAARTHPIGFRGTLDRTAVLQGSDGLVRMELLMSADEITDDRRMLAPRRATDLVVVLDRSGSMNGQKIAHARAAIHELIARLGSGDRFSLISYANQARVDVPLTSAAPTVRQHWTQVVNSISPNGGTNLSAGLDRGMQTVDHSRQSGRAARVILISDGLANQGDTTQSGLLARANRAVRGEYVLSTVGVGDDFNESLMTSLADAGTGNYYYLRDARELASVFAGEFIAASTTVASGVQVRIRPSAGVRVVEAAGYPLEYDAGEVVFRPGALFSGQKRRMWVTLEVPTGSTSEFDLGQFSLHYNKDGASNVLFFSELPRVACVEQRQEFLSRLQPEAWERSVVEEEYSSMQKNVAEFLRQGRKSEAQREIQSYKSRNLDLNATVGSAAVAEQLKEADVLLDRVDDSFSGANQSAKRKRASKELGQQSIDERRPGSKAVVPGGSK